MSHLFVLRLTVERRADQGPATWLRLEEAERGEVRHFNDVSGVLQALGQRLEAIVAESNGQA